MFDVTMTMRIRCSRLPCGTSSSRIQQHRVHVLTNDSPLLCSIGGIHRAPGGCKSFSLMSRVKETVSDYEKERQDHTARIQALPEWQASEALDSFLQGAAQKETMVPIIKNNSSLMTHHQRRAVVDSMLSTFALHIESRIAALIGKGFYTIGPCGEETLAAAALSLQPQDKTALHYRHLAINIARQLRLPSDPHMHEQPNTDSTWDSRLQQILLDRARGYAVSCFDPVTGGVHCSIGSNNGDYVNTSTLSSQCSPAVGRALATAFVNEATTKERSVSFVTLGDGSIHHAHFWSAFHLARHAKHRKIRCPVVFGISDNGLSISYKTHGYCDTLFENDPLVRLFKCDGNNIEDVFTKTKEAVCHARQYSAPVVVLYKHLQRRFGHAATDRQSAYLEQEDIEQRVESQILQLALVEAVENDELLSYEMIRHRFFQIQSWTLQAFAHATSEPKPTLASIAQRTSLPAAGEASAAPDTALIEYKALGKDKSSNPSQPRGAVMRKHMTRGIREVLEQDDKVLYLGEDVRHGGYYLVSDDLVNTFPDRVIDFPPDETALLGASLGLSQMGLVPIVEIPYAKYLDCAADMMAEIAILPWLDNRRMPRHKPEGGC